MSITVRPREQAAANWRRGLDLFGERLREPLPILVEGRLSRMVGLTLEATGCQAAIGERCRVISADGSEVDAEVVGFAGERVFLMPSGTPRGLSPNARVVPIGGSGDVPVGEHLLGRVIDGAGRPLDGLGPLRLDAHKPLYGESINPLERGAIDRPLDVGVRAINALFSVGRGQRLGLFAPSGVGKSVLLGMMTRFTDADVIVVGLVGERGREVKEFIDQILGEAGLARAVVVATPADNPPLMRMHGAAMATSIAEYFRDQGQHVLLLMDSLTRYAQAHREIALTIGEPAATRGYPPSVFARIPQLVERAGMGRNGHGSITAFYTVLTEADDPNDPVRTRRVRFSMAISCFHDSLRSGASIRRSTWRRRFPGSCRRSPVQSSYRAQRPCGATTPFMSRTWICSTSAPTSAELTRNWIARLRCALRWSASWRRV